MSTSAEVYCEIDAITIVFDKEDSHEVGLVSALRDAFGNAHARLEELDEHRCCLHSRRVGTREARR